MSFSRRLRKLEARLTNITGPVARSDEWCAFWGDKIDRKSTRLNSSHLVISYAVFCLKKKIIGYILGCEPGAWRGQAELFLPAFFVRALLASVLFRLRQSAWMAAFLYFFFNDTATTEIYTLSLHDALPI